MTPGELEDWLQTDESKSVGITHDGAEESVGHQSGRTIVEIKRTEKLTQRNSSRLTTGLALPAASSTINPCCGRLAFICTRSKGMP